VDCSIQGVSLDDSWEFIFSRQAEALIGARLEEAPAEPRLWCALGDLRHDDGCYERAWQRSGGRSARAKRSLARRSSRLCHLPPLHRSLRV